MKSTFRKISTAFAVSSFLAGASGAQAELVKYDIEPGHTLVTWFADHMGYTTMDALLSGETLKSSSEPLDLSA